MHHALKSALLAATLALAAAAPAQADAELTAAFRDPTGTVQATDNIDVWIRLTSIGDEAFTFNTNLFFDDNFGLPTSYVLPGTGNNYSTGAFNVPFATYSDISRFTFRSCNDTFTTVCNPGPYTADASTQAGSWFDQPPAFSLDPGQTLDVLVYSLAPVGLAAPAGTYQITSMGLGLILRGFDANGSPLETDLFRVGTCPSGDDGSCAFTRTVLAVPEPGSAALLLLGLLPLLAWRAKAARRGSE